VQLFIAELVQLTAGQHYNIQIGKIVLSQTETLAEVALDAIALDGESDVSLADYEAEARTLQGIWTCQDQEMAVRDLVLGVTKDALKLVAGKQTR
jgi:hypothetical protein